METPQVVSKSRRRPVAKAAAKIKTAIHLSPEAFRRLGIASVMEHKTQSDIVEALISAGLRQYVVSVRGERSGDSGEDRQDTQAA